MSKTVQCCVRGCESRDTHQHNISGATGAFGAKLTYIVRVCDDCKDRLTSKSVNFNFYRVGSLAFINEIWQ